MATKVAVTVDGGEIGPAQAGYAARSTPAISGGPRAGYGGSAHATRGDYFNFDKPHR